MSADALFHYEFEFFFVSFKENNIKVDQWFECSVYYSVLPNIVFSTKATLKNKSQNKKLKTRIEEYNLYYYKR